MIANQDVTKPPQSPINTRMGYHEPNSNCVGCHMSTIYRQNVLQKNLTFSTSGIAFPFSNIEINEVLE